MARKTLLTEAEVRQFMKLANLGPLGDAKINEMYGDTEEITEDEELEEKRGRGRGKKDNDKLEEDEDLDEGRGGSQQAKPPARVQPPMDRDEDEQEHGAKKKHMKEEEELEEMGMGAYDRDEDEMGAEVEMDADMDMDMDDAEMDADMDMGSMDDGEREELMADVVRAVAQALGIEDQVSVEAGEDDGMEGGDVDAMPEPAMDAPDMEMGDDDPMMEEDELDEANDEELVAEVARRVAQRLQAQNRKDQVIDALAERIMNRLTQK